MSQEEQKMFLKSFVDNLGDYAVNCEDEWFNLSKTTFNEIWQHNKRVFVVCHDRFKLFQNNE